MINFSPITRITLGLVLIMLSVFMLSDILGFIPNSDDALKKGRTDLAENLAVQYSLAAQKRNISAIKASMRALVSRNDEVLSAALRETSGAILAIAGDHDKHWTTTDGKSTLENITVPIYKGIRRWGAVEVSFAPLHTAGMFGFYIPPLVSMGIFILVAGYVGFLLFIKRTHDHIDPSTFVPSRVTNALNALAEGVLLLDSKGHIMLANTAFGKNMELNTEKILSRKASSIKWEFAANHDGEYPWVKAVQTGKTQVGKQLMFTCKSGEKRTFMVNSSPIQDGDGEYRGVLVTFDDITQVEEKNEQLEKMLWMVKKSRDEEIRLNDKLQILAARDPMTNCINRRSFFEKYEPACETARNGGGHLTCIMTDIDLFKSINDKFGHGLGDDVIITVASALQDSLPMADMVCRYGGEEFCIILPDASI
ncbi:MAG: diguanylate cyclase, partial [Gammaproteobacteria bacterium]|nr:diguanylate cyclase [Gammaproteobacteria bacterium]